MKLDQAYQQYFKDKVLFLTGGTGNLGSCTIYKLITELYAARVYVLVRGSKVRALQKWHRKLESHAHAITSSDRIRFIVGDIMLPNIGISASDLRTLEEEVNIVIHQAADLSLIAPIWQCVKNNCDPVLDLASLATSFKRLQRFVFVSSVYANSFLPDGPVVERVYGMPDELDEDIDVELEHAQIVQTHSSSLTKRFAWPYAFSKYLAERLLLERHSALPLLIVRSSTIGPALRTPFSLFGDEESLPIQQGSKIYLRDPATSKIWHAPAGSSSGSNILDEIPVDWVSNVLLLHVATGTRGVVHASAGNFVQRTADELLDFAQAGTAIQWVEPGTAPQCALANFLVIGNRGWDFSCDRSVALQEVRGPLDIHVTVDDERRYHQLRHQKLMEDIRKESSA